MYCTQKGKIKILPKTGNTYLKKIYINESLYIRIMKTKKTSKSFVYKIKNKVLKIGLFTKLSTLSTGIQKWIT